MKTVYRSRKRSRNEKLIIPFPVLKESSQTCVMVMYRQMVNYSSLAHSSFTDSGWLRVSNYLVLSNVYTPDQGKQARASGLPIYTAHALGLYSAYSGLIPWLISRMVVFFYSTCVVDKIARTLAGFNPLPNLKYFFAGQNPGLFKTYLCNNMKQ